MNFYDELVNVVSEEVLRDEPMSRHTTFRVGGPADYYVAPKSSEIADIIKLCKLNKMPCTLIGNGSNLLVGDGGIRGLVIELGSGMQEIKLDGCRIEVEAGALLGRVSKVAAEAGLTGLEFASGIPGNIGGALVMNAGAYGGEMKDVLESVTVLTAEPELALKTYQLDEYEGEYRTSRLMKERLIVLSARLKLSEGNPSEILAKMEELKAKRIEKQPLEFPSAGSTFKRPEGYFAGKLIMDAGLSGYTVGGAMVSPKHCGFVVNAGNARARDIRQLIEDVTQIVWEKFQVKLEPEIRFLGEF